MIETSTSGVVSVDGETPGLSERRRAEFSRSVVRRWGPAIAREAKRSGVPWYWIAGTIWAESNGNPRAVSPVGAVGLMQLYSAGARAGYSAREVFEPNLNIRLGARLLGRLAKDGAGLHEVSSMYNAGSAKGGGARKDARSRWGVFAQPGHIDRVVAASNAAALMVEPVPAAEQRPAAHGTGGSLGLAFGVVVAAVCWHRWAGG